jgi:hypothetical protein
MDNSNPHTMDFRIFAILLDVSVDWGSAPQPTQCALRRKASREGSAPFPPKVRLSEELCGFVSRVS